MSKITARKDMLLYRYFSLEHAIQTLEEGRLKVGRLKELNDPFDCWPKIENLPSKVLGFEDGFAKGMRDTWGEYCGVLCFSAVIQDPVMWSHYSDGHRGIALGFDIPEHDRQVKVEYSKDRPILDYSILTPTTPELAATVVNLILKKIYKYKALSWQYEQEHRLFIMLEKCTAQRGLYFTPLPELKARCFGSALHNG